MFGPTIRGKLVVLRPMRTKDAPSFCHWLANREVTRFLLQHDDPPSLREEREYIAQQRRRQDAVQWAMETSEGIHVGSTSLMRWDREQRRAEFGIFIGDPRYWGQGLGTQAGRLVLAYGFGKLKLHRIYLTVYAYNVRGIRSYRRLGFLVEGRMRDHLYRDRHFHDVITMGILAGEFNRTRSYGKS